MDPSDEFFDELPIDADEPIYSSGVVSRLLQIPVWVLKQLDEEGIVSPPRKTGQSRLYSKRELKKLHRIQFYMKEKGIKVRGLSVVLEMEATIERLHPKKTERRRKR